MKRHLLLLLALLPSLLPAPAAADEPLATAVVRPRSVAAGLAAEGVVEALSQATVAAQVAGRIVDMRADAGQQVRKGEVLLRIDAREAAEAAAAARSQLAVAQAQFERSRQLRQQNFISQAGFDKARADYDAARAAAAQAGVGLGHATVTAPIAGVVARRHAEAGEMAALGRPLLTLYDPSGLRVVASIPQQRLREARAATRARIEFPELGRVVEAASVQLLPAADAATHVTPVRLNLPPNIDGLIPGMAARVTFVTGEAEKLLVPVAALVRRGEVTAVYVAGEKGPVLRQVRLGEPAAPGEVEVLAGLAAGERIVLDPARAAIALRAGR